MGVSKEKLEEENQKLKSVIKEVRTLASFYNFWDMQSMRMALGSIKDKLKGIDDKNN